MIHCVVADREPGPVFRFGLISDIQYADFDDRYSVVGKRRYYRAALPSLERAISEWNSESVDFAIQCGDIVDGLNRTNQQSAVALERVLEKLKTFDGETKHVLGNHCTCQFERSVLLKKLQMKSDVGYYSFRPVPSWKMVVLDTCDISLYAWPKDHPHHQAARVIMERENPNSDWANPTLLQGARRRFVSYNGGVGDVQLEWLKRELESAQKIQQNVIIFTHIPIEPEGVMPGGILWNFDQVQKVLHQYTCVKAVFSGHVHEWVHSVDVHGIHYLTLPGVVEQSPGTQAHGRVDVYEDSLVVDGFGKTDGFVMKWA